jgi:quinolinate synthase
MQLPVVEATATPSQRYEDPLDLMDEIESLKKEKDATILAHYYVDGEIQDVADFTGDSLKLCRDAAGVRSSVIVFAGVHFMAESAKMLNPDKKVLIPDLLAGCSLAESCPYDQRQRSRTDRTDPARQGNLVRSRPALGPLPGRSHRPQNDSVARLLHGARNLQPAGPAAGQEE